MTRTTKQSQTLPSIEDTVVLLDRITRGSNGQPGLIAQIAQLSSRIEDLKHGQECLESKIESLSQSVGEFRLEVTGFILKNAADTSSWIRFRDKLLLPVAASVITTAVLLFLALK